MTPLERFHAKYLIDPNTGCWLWTGALNADGYGWFRIDGSSRGAHRVGYELTHGELAPGVVLDHLCRVRNCVNPDHLEPVTDRINILRGESPQAINARKTHCPEGHAYDETNTYILRGHRYCRACNRRRVSEYAARKKQARSAL